MNLTGKVDSAATAELVVAAVAGAAGTDHKDQVTDCKSILAIEARARAARPLKFHQRVLLSSAKTMQHKIRWHRSHPEKRDEAWSEDDIGVYIADMTAAGDRGGSRKGRVLQHLSGRHRVSLEGCFRQSTASGLRDAPWKHQYQANQGGGHSRGSPVISRSQGRSSGGGQICPSPTQMGGP